MRTIGDGNISEGARICVMWGAHFCNLGLNTEMDLRPHWLGDCFQAPTNTRMSSV